ncbi:MAG TPA: FtsX-like permease family protein [Steroidobacteraceae bacterium]|nr:FtsX-like permease family protein [Steroidobacteraceae bacterium]
MDIRPICSTLLRHKTAAGLIVLEVALTCAIICNAVFMIGSRLERMQRPTGIAERELVRVTLAGIGADADASARTEQDLAALRAIPGVRYAAATNEVPLGGSSWNSGIRLTPDQKNDTTGATNYLGTADLLETLGVRLISGRDFLPEEYTDARTVQSTSEEDTRVPSVIITKSLADKLFPAGNALGQTLYIYGRNGHKVVGIIDTLLRPSERGGDVAFNYSTIFPITVGYDVGGTYLMRVPDPSQRARVLQAARAALNRVNPNRIILGTDTFDEIRAGYYQNDRAMAWLLVVVCVALLVVTAFGVIGLASFWVAQRRRQIGIRRALGATRRQVLRYFQTENFLLSSMGIVIGMLLAYGLNQVLMTHYELPRLPLLYLPVGALLLWALGQVAVLGPALRAAAVPPAVATRSA